MKTISLFSGCGGMDLGFIQEGFDVIFANDFDKYAVQSYAHNIGNHIVHGDLSKIHEFEVPAHDLAIFGFPCQIFSLMGSQAGFLDKVRGTLFFEAARILDFHRPAVAVIENVRNLKNHGKGNTFRVILDTLDKLNYQVQYEVLNSADFGTPQTRNRVFLVCIRKDIAERMTQPFEFPKAQPLTKTLQSILEHDVDPKYYLSHKILPTILAHGSGNYYSKSEIDLTIARPLTATMAKMHRANQDNYVTQPSELAEVAGKTNVRRLTPRECARLQGFPEDFEIIVSDAQAYKQFGNAVTVNVAAAIAKNLKAVLPQDVLKGKVSYV